MEDNFYRKKKDESLSYRVKNSLLYMNILPTNFWDLDSILQAKSYEGMCKFQLLGVEPTPFTKANVSSNNWQRFGLNRIEPRNRGLKA